jgi:uncharacterized protein YbaP (TraB family)
MHAADGVVCQHQRLLWWQQEDKRQRRKQGSTTVRALVFMAALTASAQAETLVYKTDACNVAMQTTLAQGAAEIVLLRAQLKLSQTLQDESAVKLKRICNQRRNKRDKTCTQD